MFVDDGSWVQYVDGSLIEVVLEFGSVVGVTEKKIAALGVSCLPSSGGVSDQCSEFVGSVPRLAERDWGSIPHRAPSAGPSSAASGNVCAFDQLPQRLVVSVPVSPDDVAPDHGVLLLV